MMANKSYRKRFMFWLDYKKQNELELADEIDNLKRARSFTRAIRDGLRLFISLSKGDISVLEELFPHVVATIRGSSDASADRGGLTEEKIRAIIREATRDLTARGNPQPLTSVPTPKPLILDDGLPTITVTKSEGATGVNVAQNFLKGLGDLMKS